MGVDVIRIDSLSEGRGTADRQRRRAFDSENRNKRSVVLDLKRPAAKEAFCRLADTADVVLECFKPGTAKRLGIDFETLGSRNPRLVYCSLSGYGQDGPYAEFGLTDTTASAARGAWYPVGDTVQTPSWIGVLTADAGGAVHAALGIVAALLARSQTGRGTLVDVALADSVSTFNIAALQQALAGAPRTRPPHLERAALKCKDGKFLMVADSAGSHWAAFCEAIGRPDLAGLLQADRQTRLEGYADIRAAMLSRTRDEWLPIIAATGTPMAPCLEPSDIVADPQVVGRGLIWDLEHPIEGAVRQWGVPIKFPEAPASLERFAPRAGEHTASVLSELGYSAAEIVALAAG
jgi:crotonobetainyl-CoA:carnitine CoA-transferase CaiB-like acyl-CoA transferase